jgi:phosphomevalonate kinase
MIAGEYAVLDGAEAVVAAVDRRSYALWGGWITADAAPAEARAAAAAAAAALGRAPLGIDIDASALRQRGHKLGLGSSAATAAAAAGAAFADAGLDPADAAVRERILAAALEGHRAVAPDGSGADVAASVLGGFLRFRRLGDGVETHPLRWPESIATRVAWTGIEVRTSDMLDRVRALGENDPASHRALMTALGERAEAVVSALLDEDIAGVIQGVDASADAMADLGRAAQAGIVNDTIQRIRDLARLAGGAAKPSGAGGGDVVFAVFPGEGAAEEFASACTQAGVELLSVGLGAEGVRSEGH